MDADYGFDASPLVLSGSRIRAGFHCHTLHSDGGLSPASTVNEYRAKGYQCLGITDHFGVTPTAAFTASDFVGIDSTENGGYPDVIGVGVTSAVPADWPLSERASALASQGAFTIAAHPTYCAATPEMYTNAADLMAIEIYNAYCDEAYCNGLATELWDMVLGQGKRLWGVAGDDAHLNRSKRYYSRAGRAWVEIWSATFTHDAILSALKRGAFFSTQGPRFERIEIRQDGIQIECSAVRQVRWRTFGKVGFVDYADAGASLTHSALPNWYHPTAFVRIELVDDQGKKAWSNPFFVTSGSANP
jgi:predicted metal-dependent phosphoesterase TrpH